MAPSQKTLQAALDAKREQLKVPGVAIGILLDGREIVATSGVTSVDNPLPVTDSTLFMIGSTTKTFTATTLMRLVEQGKVSLDDLVTKHIPTFRLKDRAATRALTVRHLVTHTGGWDGDINNDTGWGDDALARFVADLRTQPQLVPVGAHFSYNNSGFSVLGRIIEVVTGKTYEAAVTELVFKPLGMSSSFFSPVDVMTRRFAVGHTSGEQGPEVAHALGIGRSGAPAGAIASSVRDQLKYARFHLGDGRNADGKRVLKPSTMRLMQQPQHSAVGLAGHVGISWLIGEVGGATTVGHGGNVSNLQLSSFTMVPSRNFAVTVLTNSGSGGALHAQMGKWVLEKYLGLVDKLPEVLDSKPGQLREYAGEYSGKLSTIKVAAVDGHLELTSRWTIALADFKDPEERAFIRKLLAQKPSPMNVRLTAPDQVVVTDGPGQGARGEFVRDKPDGQVRWLRWGGRLNTRKG